MAVDDNDQDGPDHVDIRLRGKTAARFKRLHDQLLESEDLDHVKLGDMSLSKLGSYAICEWMKLAESRLVDR